MCLDSRRIRQQSQTDGIFDFFNEQPHKVMVSSYISHFKVIDAVLKPRESVAHIVDQIEYLQIRCFVAGMVAGILFMGKILFRQELFYQFASALWPGFGVVFLQILDPQIKVESLKTLGFFSRHYAALSRWA